MLGYWRELGILALVNLSAAFTLMLARAFANVGRDAPRTDVAMQWLARALLALALVCLLNLREFLPQLQMTSVGMWLLSAVLVMVAAVQALRRRRPPARPMLFIWLRVYLIALVRGLISIGWMPQNSVTLYGFQAGLAFAAFLLSLAKIGRAHV